MRIGRTRPRLFPASGSTTSAIRNNLASHTAPLRFSSPLLLLFSIVVSPLPIGGVYSRPSCEFHSANYSLEWAYEPSSASVVFVLRAALPRNEAVTPMWTGVGFGDRSRDPFIDFIGVFVDRGQAGITDAHIHVNTAEDGDDKAPKLRADLNTNVQTISVEMDNQSSWLKATFARTAVAKSHSNNQDHELKIEGCNFFNLPLRMFTEESGRSGNVLRSLKKLKVCDIAKQCSVRLEDLKLKGLNNKDSQRNEYKIVFANNQLRREEVIKEEPIPSKQLGHVAHSVDVSGTGDPCSFTGNHYTVNWTYNDVDDSVHFTMLQPIKKGKWWSAVGIGEWMANMDIGVIFLESGKVQQIGDYFSSDYSVPAKDAQQDWKVGKSRIVKVKKDGGQPEEDRVELKFSRKITTSDKEKDHSMEGCVLFQFAANGGRYGQGYAIRKHDDWPDLYKACDLEKRCAGSGGAAASIDSKPTTLLPHGSTQSNNTAESDGAVEIVAHELNATITTNNLTASDVSLAGSNGTSSPVRVSLLGEKKDVGGEVMPVGVAAEPTLSNATIQMKKRQENETVLAEPIPTTTVGPTLAPTNDTQVTTTDPPNGGVSTPNTARLDGPESTKSTTVLQLFGEFPNNTTNATVNGGISETSARESSTSRTTTVRGHHATRPAGKPPTLPIRANGEGEATTTSAAPTTAAPSSESTSDARSTITTTVGFTSKSTSESINQAQSTTTVSATETTPANTPQQATAQTTAIPPPIAPTISQPPSLSLNDTASDTTVELTATSSATPSTIAESSPRPATTNMPTSTSTPGPTTTPPHTTSAHIHLEPKVIEVKQNNKTLLLNESPRGVNPNVTSHEPSSSPQPVAEAAGMIDACSALKPDLKVCHSYMSNYFEQVRRYRTKSVQNSLHSTLQKFRWSDKHNEPMEAQLGKVVHAVAPLMAILNPRIQIFHAKCAGHL